MKEVETLEIDGKEYFLVDKIKENNNTYYYFAEEENPSNIRILKEKKENLINTETEKEFNDALILFFNTHKDDIKEETTK